MSSSICDIIPIQAIKGGRIVLIFDFAVIGNNLYSFRKKARLTQAEVAEAAGIADRTYADIERGTVNMRVETLLRICTVLKITPNEILLTEDTENKLTETLSEKLENISPNEKKVALNILDAYLKSI